MGRQSQKREILSLSSIHGREIGTMLKEARALNRKYFKPRAPRAYGPREAW